MARTLGSTLTSAVQSLGQQPAAQITMHDPNVAFTLVGSRATNGRTDAKLTAAGTLLRATVTQNADPNNLIVDRITSVTSATQWQSTPSPIAIDAAAGCAIGILGTRIRIFYQSHTDLKVYYRESNDDGVTWSGETATNGSTPYSIGNFGFGLAATDGSSVWIAWSAYATNNTAISVSTVSSGVWSAWSIVGPSTPPYGQLRGLRAETVGTAAVFTGGLQVTQSLSGIAAGWFTLTSGAYSAYNVLRNQDNPNLGITLANPTAHYDSASGDYYVALMTQDDGSRSGTVSNRTELLIGTSLGSLSPVAALAVFKYNAHFMTIPAGYPSSGSLIAFDGASCYLQPPPAAPVDVSADLLQLHLTEDLDKAAVATITLSNDQGQWNNHPSVRVDAPILLSLGYGPPSGAPGSPNLVQTHTLLLETYEYQSTPTQRNLILHCFGMDKRLDYATPVTQTWTNTSVGDLLTAICTAANMPLDALPATSQFSQTVPSFTLTAGETYRTALHRVAAIYGFETHTDSAGNLVVIEPQASDPDTWDYGTEVLGSTYAYSADQPNHLRIVGYSPSPGVTIAADVLDTANYDAIGRERYAQIADRQIDTTGKAQLAAQLALAQVQRQATSAAISCGMNPRHELSDVITLTDPLIGLPQTRLRISAIHWIITTENASWLNQLTLTGV